MAEVLDYAPLTMDKTPMNRDTLAGDVAVVTGGAGNIGLGISRSLAWLGAKVVVVGRNPDTGNAAVELINRENKPGTAIFISTDVSSEASMKAMADKAFETFGKVDILVNNAMDMSLGALILKTSVAALDRAIRGSCSGRPAGHPGVRARHAGKTSWVGELHRYHIPQSLRSQQLLRREGGYQLHDDVSGI